MVVFFQQADVFIFVGEYLPQYGLIDRIRIGEHFHGFFQFCRVVYALVEESPFGSPALGRSLMCSRYKAVCLS